MPRFDGGHDWSNRTPIGNDCSAPVQVDVLLVKAGSRRYMLDAAEFWAMRELVELSKGAFSSLPGWLNAILQRATDLTTSCLLAHSV